ncbi:MAG TPA: hypothetical protein VEC57_00355 [Candidatus Limnocylindrales bacterium]|nr:hypothetical protein [Candidatus Limnocylindrales bacterium]
MEPYRLGLKLFAEGAKEIALTEFIPIFHRWIRDRTFDGPLLDVADYSHVHHGPGVLLAGFDANYCMDVGDGSLGLMWYNKRPTQESVADVLVRGARRAVEMALRLQDEPELRGRLSFTGSPVLVFANDRLHAPNTTSGWSYVSPGFESLAARLYGGNSRIERQDDPRERLAARLHSNDGSAGSLDDLAARLR